MSRTKGPDLFAETLPGEFQLFAAICHRIVQDIRCQSPRRVLHESGGSTTVSHQISAVESVADPQGGVAEWAELLGLDGDWVREQLMVQAGLTDATAHLDENHSLPGSKR